MIGESATSPIGIDLTDCQSVVSLVRLCEAATSGTSSSMLFVIDSMLTSMKGLLGVRLLCYVLHLLPDLVRGCPACSLPQQWRSRQESIEQSGWQHDSLFLHDVGWPLDFRLDALPYLLGSLRRW